MERWHDGLLFDKCLICSKNEVVKSHLVPKNELIRFSGGASVSITESSMITKMMGVKRANCFNWLCAEHDLAFDLSDSYKLTEYEQLLNFWIKINIYIMERLNHVAKYIDDEEIFRHVATVYSMVQNNGNMFNYLIQITKPIQIKLNHVYKGYYITINYLLDTPVILFLTPLDGQYILNILPLTMKAIQPKAHEKLEKDFENYFTKKEIITVFKECIRTPFLAIEPQELRDVREKMSAFYVDDNWYLIAKLYSEKLIELDI